MLCCLCTKAECDKDKVNHDFSWRMKQLFVCEASTCDPPPPPPLINHLTHPLSTSVCPLHTHTHTHTHKEQGDYMGVCDVTSLPGCEGLVIYRGPRRRHNKRACQYNHHLCRHTQTHRLTQTHTDTHRHTQTRPPPSYSRLYLLPALYSSGETDTHIHLLFIAPFCQLVRPSSNDKQDEDSSQSPSVHCFSHTHTHTHSPDTHTS